MIRGKPNVSTAQLIDALEAEILAASDAEIRDLLREAERGREIAAIRFLVARAINDADHAANPPPPLQPRPTMRRP